MESIGIVAEYNPFHNGHLHHLNEARKIAGIKPVVCVMSGCFTQRGDAALLDKWARAAAAVRSGVDLVVELPVAFAARSAQDFASGAVRLLHAMSASVVCFGAEYADAALLSRVASISTHPATIARLKRNLKSGASYAAALTGAIEAQLPSAGHVLTEPNNVLGIEYIKAIQQYAPGVEPLPIQRIGSGHHRQEINGSIASATAIRKALMDHPGRIWPVKQVLPKDSYTAIETFLTKNAQFPSIRNLDAALLALLRTMRTEELAEIAGVSEGLEYKLFDAALKSTTMEEVLSRVKSKRYPRSRLRRILIHCLLGTRKSLLRSFDAAGPLYVRVLAFNSTGRAMLKDYKTACVLPVVVKTSEFLTTSARARQRLNLMETMLSMDTCATDLYALCHKEKKAGALDFTKSPAYIA